ncbi:hypothetical protein BDW68DRAFT_170211 [Aspergillus falconensis]
MMLSILFSISISQPPISLSPAQLYRHIRAIPTSAVCFASTYLTTDCAVFYQCTFDGTPIELRCPPGLLFDYVLNLCDFPITANCYSSTSPKW